MVSCTTLWWDGAGKGRGWKTAAIIYCWQQQHVRGRTAQLSDISSGATCVADLDSGALALTKEASGNSRDWQFYRQEQTPIDIIQAVTYPHWQSYSQEHTSTDNYTGRNIHPLTMVQTGTYTHWQLYRQEHTPIDNYTGRNIHHWLLLTLDQIPGAARDFSPQVNFQFRHFHGICRTHQCGIHMH